MKKREKKRNVRTEGGKRTNSEGSYSPGGRGIEEITEVREIPSHKRRYQTKPHE